MNLEHLELWQRYKADPSNTALRNELAGRYHKWVWKIVHTYRRNHPLSSRMPDELFSDGWLGLLEAIKSFDPDVMSRSFTGYSFYYIVRWMRCGFHRSTQAERRYLCIRQSRVKLGHQAGSRLNDFELATALGMTEAQLAEIIHAGRHRWTTSLDAILVPQAATACSPEQDVETRDRVESVLKFVNERQRAVLWMCFAQGTSFREAGKQLGLSGPRVEQISKQARDRIQSKLVPAA